jgi:uncharacterized protein YcbK (DUF882 family)
MRAQSKITRRFVLSLGIVPVAVHASPLINLEHGLGLFSNPKGPSKQWPSNRLNLYHDPEPELQEFEHLRSNKLGKIIINQSLNLNLLNSNTKEEILLRFSDNHELSTNQRLRLDTFLRDWRTNEIKSIDSIVLENFFTICELCSNKKNILHVNIHSGYRSKKTNEYLRNNNHKVARNSMHILAKAIDFSIPEIGANRLASISRANTQGGVGSYQNFVHLDSGPKRSW